MVAVKFLTTGNKHEAILATGLRNVFSAFFSDSILFIMCTLRMFIIIIVIITNKSKRICRSKAYIQRVKVLSYFWKNFILLSFDFETIESFMAECRVGTHWTTSCIHCKTAHFSFVCQTLACTGVVSSCAWTRLCVCVCAMTL